MMKRAFSATAVTLLLVAAFIVPLVLLRPTGDRLDGGAATPPPDSTAVADATPSPSPGDPTCGTATVSYDAAEPTIENEAEGASVVAIATVESVGAARWNTTDGKAPTFSDSPSDSAYIYRPLSISISSVARGDIADMTVEANLLGGTVGCYSFVFEDSPEVKKGQRYAFFMGPALTQNGDTDSSTLTINTAWPIADDQVITPLEGNIALGVFSATVEAAPQGPFGNASD